MGMPIVVPEVFYKDEMIVGTWLSDVSRGMQFLFISHPQADTKYFKFMSVVFCHPDPPFRTEVSQSVI